MLYGRLTFLYTNSTVTTYLSQILPAFVQISRKIPLPPVKKVEKSIIFFFNITPLNRMKIHSSRCNHYLLLIMFHGSLLRPANSDRTRVTPILLLPFRCHKFISVVPLFKFLDFVPMLPQPLLDVFIIDELMDIVNTAFSKSRLIQIAEIGDEVFF